MNKNVNNTRKLAWNGIILDIPRDCDDIVSGLRRIALEKDFRPILELRWEEASKKHPLEEVDTVAGRFLKADDDLTASRAVPEPFGPFVRQKKAVILQSIGPETSYTFIWKTGSNRMICTCRLFAHPALSLADGAAILQSMQVREANDAEIPWVVQDFRLVLPAEFRLTGYTFAAGLTRLGFTGDSLHLQTCRLAPAMDKLKTSSLPSLLRSLHPGLDGPDLGENATDTTAEARTTPPVATQILSRLRRKKPFVHGLLRHDVPGDRLLAVIGESSKPIPDVLIHSISARYETVFTK